MLKYCKTVFLISLMMLFVNVGCKNPHQPEIPESYHYHDAQAIYDRSIAVGSTGVSAVKNVDRAYLVYKLFDPEGKTRSENDQEFVAGYRIGYVGMEKVGEGKFQARLESVFVQTENRPQKHIVYARDLSFQGEEDDPTFSSTGRGIDIQGAYDLKIVAHEDGGSGTMLTFKMKQ